MPPGAAGGDNGNQGRRQPRWQPGERAPAWQTRWRHRPCQYNDTLAMPIASTRRQRQYDSHSGGRGNAIVNIVGCSVCETRKVWCGTRRVWGPQSVASR
eukprot:364299-Chlamydomonas_euryale.AAC.6